MNTPNTIFSNSFNPVSSISWADSNSYLYIYKFALITEKFRTPVLRPGKSAFLVAKK